jgi:TP901 family phage tail tape measure protein
VEVARISAIVTANTSQFLRGMAQVDAAVTATSAKMTGMTASLAASSSRMTSIGSTLTRRMTLPLVALGGASVVMSAKFEQSMAKIEGLVGVAGRDVDKMASQVRKLGPAYGKSAGEAGDALFFITSAGLRGKDAMDTLESSLKASAVGLGDTATVADLATSAMNAYGSSVLPASQATDVMVSAVREGKLQADELAGSMGRVLPLASAMGVGFDQVGAAFAALSRTGTGAAEAATQIRGILASIQKPTKMAADTLAEYGLSAGDLRKQIREKGLLSVLQTLTTTFGDNEEAQARVFGNIRALSGVMDLMGANSAETEKIFRSLAQSTGATDKAFAVMEQTVGYRLSKAFEQMKQSLMEVGDVIAPVVTKIFEGVSYVVSAFQNLPGPMKTTVAIAGMVAAALGPLIWIAGKVAGSLVALKLAMMGMGAAGAGAAVLGGAAGGAAGKVGMLAGALPLLANPLGLLAVLRSRSGSGSSSLASGQTSQRPRHRTLPTSRKARSPRLGWFLRRSQNSRAQ